jgi:hypothetical protein
MALFRRPKVASDDLVELQEWVESRGAITGGVEAYVEPQTSFSPTTVVLVAGDGEFIRRKVGSAHAAAKFARSVGIPIYHAERVGLPQRMRDYAVRQQGGGRQPGSGTAARAPGHSPRERDAIQTLATAALMAAPPPDADRADLLALLRAARARAHPDRNSGDRALWDAVDDAAHVLGLR